MEIAVTFAMQVPRTMTSGGLEPEGREGYVVSQEHDLEKEDIGRHPGRGGRGLP